MKYKEEEEWEEALDHFFSKIEDWIEENVDKKQLCKIEQRESISEQLEEEEKLKDEENLSKCSDQTLQSIDWKEKRSEGDDWVDEELIKGREMLISMKRWSEELNPKLEWASHLNEETKSNNKALNRERSIIDEECKEFGEIWVMTPKTLIQNKSWDAK